MIILAFEFKYGRYHATKWGSAVNEGIVDWPPSPWRIMRAIIHSWKMYHSHLEENKVWPILQTLLSSKVSFQLPQARQAHTRHYVPLPRIENGKIKKTKMLDTFVVMSRESRLYVIFEDVILTKEQTRILDAVVGSIRYLGRIESLCSVTLYHNRNPLEIKPNCVLMGDIMSEDREIVDVLVPTENARLSDMCMNTRELHEVKKMIYPPESKIVQYLRAPDSLSSFNPMHSSGLPYITAVRYIITGRVRPLITDTIKIGDATKRAVMSAYKKQSRGRMSGTFSGMNESGNIIRRNHAHAFFLPTDDDNDSRLDHLTIVSKTPFNSDELAALEKIKYIYYGEELLKTTPSMRGRMEEFKAPILQRSKRWRTVTPYVPNKHTKVRGSGSDKHIVDGPEDQLLGEIQNRGMPRVKDITITRKKIGRFLPMQFKRWRKDGLPGFGAYAVDIKFEEEVAGPLSLGHASHFGLGLFVPND